MTTLCTVSPPQLHHSAAAASQLHQSCQLRRALCRPAAARPGPAGPPAVCHPRLQPLTTTTPRLQHPYTTRCRLLDSAWLSQGCDPARLSLGLGHTTVGPNRQSLVSAPLRLQPCPRPPGSRMSPPGAGQCVSLVCPYVPVYVPEYTYALTSLIFYKNNVVPALGFELCQSLRREAQVKSPREGLSSKSNLQQ